MCWSRLVAGLTGLNTWVILSATHWSGTEPYAAVLLGTVAVASAAVGARLWEGPTLLRLYAAGVLAIVVLGWQVLALTAGDPMHHRTELGVRVVLLGLASLLTLATLAGLLLSRARRRQPLPPTQAHPYAL